MAATALVGARGLSGSRTSGPSVDQPSADRAQGGTAPDAAEVEGRREYSRAWPGGPYFWSVFRTLTAQLAYACILTWKAKIVSNQTRIIA